MSTDCPPPTVPSRPQTTSSPSSSTASASVCRASSTTRPPPPPTARRRRRPWEVCADEHHRNVNFLRPQNRPETTAGGAPRHLGGRQGSGTPDPLRTPTQGVLPGHAKNRAAPPHGRCGDGRDVRKHLQAQRGP